MPLCYNPEVKVHAEQAVFSDDSSNPARMHQARQAQSKLTKDPDKALLDFAQLPPVANHTVITASMSRALNIFSAAKTC